MQQDGIRLARGRFYGEILRLQEMPGFILTETRYHPGQRIPPHSHEHAYFCLIRQGTYEETFGRQRRACGPSTLAYHPPSERHSEVFHGREVRSFNIEIKADWLDHLSRHSVILDRPAEFRSGPLLVIAQRLYREFSQADPISRLAMEGLVLELLVEATRHHSRAAGGGPPASLARARDLIQAHYAEGLSLPEIAQSVGMHPASLAKRFRQYYQCTIGDYVRQLRVDFAGRELTRTGAPLVEVALAAGFCDQSHFCKTFKRLTGLTPAEYRRRFRAA